MSNWLSRIVVAIVGLPIVLGVVYLGGWWVFAMATLAAFVALHEFWLLARPLAPLAPAGYVGAALALVGAEIGGVPWMVGGLLTSFVLAFILKAISEARAAATIAISAHGDGRRLGRRRPRVPDPPPRAARARPPRRVHDPARGLGG